MKYKHIKLISLLIDWLTVDYKQGKSVNDYLLDNGIRYPEKAMHELTLEVQERLAKYE